MNMPYAFILQYFPAGGIIMNIKMIFTEFYGNF